MPFRIVRNDITRVKADAIVNTANPQPIYGSGTDSAIYRAAGEKALLRARQKIGTIARGKAVETPAFKLKAKYIIHTVGPVWNGGNDNEFEVLQNCYENSLQLADKLGCKSVAFPLISSGAYGFPKDKALSIALSTIQDFLMTHEMVVELVVFDADAFELSAGIMESVSEYVDSNYVDEARKREYGRQNRLPLQEKAFHVNRVERSETTRLREKADCDESVTFNFECVTPSYMPSASIDEFIGATDATFQERLFEIIDSRGLTGPQVYKNYVSKQVYSKIQADREYHPNKATALALCMALKLDLNDTLDLIGRAGWTLSPSNKADLIIKWCILHNEYNLVNVNIILFKFGCPEFEKIK